MKFGVREIANVVFRAKTSQKIGNKTFAQGQPVFYIDSAKTSTLEGAATTVYAQGGRGNTRLIAWEGEKTLTFTVEDALLSPVSFSMLSGAGLIKGTNSEKVHFHQTTATVVGAGGVITLTDALGDTETVCGDAPLYVMTVDSGGDLTGDILTTYTVSTTAAAAVTTAGSEEDAHVVGKTLEWSGTGSAPAAGTGVMVDYYVIKKADTVSELQIDAENFAGYYYVEADTLFRRQKDGVDLPANLTLPNVKIQSNFTFSMASTGDPSTFTFTMDALPGYTYFNPSRKVLCAIQIVDDANAVQGANNIEPVFPHKASETVPAEAAHDSTVAPSENSGTNP